MKQYSTISIIVKSGDNYRVFTTESFTIRPAVNILQRYNPDYSILAVKDGEFPEGIQADNTGWTNMAPLEADTMMQMAEMSGVYEIPADRWNYRRMLLENFPYRKAMNLWYVHCAKNGIYPSKQPFKGVYADVPEWVKKEIGTCEHHTFISDENNPYIDKSDVLKWYEGRRIEKMIGGHSVQGYLLTKIRERNNMENGL